jgi:NRPS condensation-like uncharacterized protein
MEPSMTATSLVPLQRRLDRAEAFFWFLDRFSSMNFALIAPGHGALDDAALQAALDAAQRRHPLLAVAIETDIDQRLCFVAHPWQGIALERLDLAGDGDGGFNWRPALAERIVRPFALGESPLLRAYRFDGAGQDWVIALVVHHSIADARSGFSLLNEILLGAAGVPVPREAIAPRPTLLELYPPAFAGDAGRQLGGQLKAARRAASERSGLPEAQARYQSVGAPLQPRIISLTLPTALCAKLQDGARAAGATVNGVIGAAQLIALRRLFGDASERILGLTCAADLRPYLSAPMDAQTPGFYVTLITSVQRVGDQASLWTLAQRLSASIRQQIELGAAHLLYEFLPPAELFPATDDGVRTFSALMARAPQTSLLSNVGVLAPIPELAALGVSSRSFALCPTPTQPMFTAVTTDAAGMTLHLNYNAARLADDAAREVAEAMQALLCFAGGVGAG